MVPLKMKKWKAVMIANNLHHHHLLQNIHLLLIHVNPINKINRIYKHPYNQIHLLILINQLMII
jgi:hypothetical protein